MNTINLTYLEDCNMSFLQDQNLQPDLLDVESDYNIALAHYAIAVAERRRLALKVLSYLPDCTLFCALLYRAGLRWADEQVEMAHAVLVGEASK